jgi:hypothetical protein
VELLLFQEYHKEIQEIHQVYSESLQQVAAVAVVPKDQLVMQHILPEQMVYQEVLVVVLVDRHLDLVQQEQEVQETLHQHLHHKVIQVEIMLAVVVVVPVAPALQVLQEEQVELVQQLLGYLILMEHQDHLLEDGLLAVVEVADFLDLALVELVVEETVLPPEEPQEPQILVEEVELDILHNQGEMVQMV